MTALSSGGKSSMTVRQMESTSTWVILMAKPVADSTDVAAWEAWAESSGLFTKASRSFADHLQLALDGRDGVSVSAEPSRVHFQRKLPDCGDCVGDVAQGK
jgi:hypothetical protein